MLVLLRAKRSRKKREARTFGLLVMVEKLPASQTDCDKNQVSVTCAIIRDHNPFIDVNSSEKPELWPCWRLPGVSLSQETVEGSAQTSHTFVLNKVLDSPFFGRAHVKV